ncbi:MAG: DUF3592 domain-containing protein [Ruminococcus sp.]|nr:DUF3592 domain-containing protein [Ruminococcus sp.]
MKKKNLISGIMLILFSVAFMGVGVWFSGDHEHKLINCTEQVTATVIENIEDTQNELIYDYRQGHRDEHYSDVKYYTPLFEYEYDGNNYKSRGQKSRYSPLYKVGEETEIKINPSNPNEFYEVKSNSYNIKSKVIMMLSGFFMILGIFMLIKSGRKT